jgi:hypothetical protein
MTLGDARKKGWIIEVGEDFAIAAKRSRRNPHPPITVHSDNPSFSLAVAIAEAEGRGFLHGHGLSLDVPCYHKECCANDPQRPTAPSKRVVRNPHLPSDFTPPSVTP